MRDRRSLRTLARKASAIQPWRLDVSGEEGNA
jgi:hypothetical protein